MQPGIVYLPWMAWMAETAPSGVVNRMNAHDLHAEGRESAETPRRGGAGPLNARAYGSKNQRPRAKPPQAPSRRAADGREGSEDGAKTTGESRSLSHPPTAAPARLQEAGSGVLAAAAATAHHKDLLDLTMDRKDLRGRAEAVSGRASTRATVLVAEGTTRQWRSGAHLLQSLFVRARWGTCSRDGHGVDCRAHGGGRG